MSIDEMASKIDWLGHDGFRINGSKVIYIDPYEISGGVEADFILVTHEHFDHCSPQDIAKVTGEKTVIITEKDSAGKISGDVRIVKPGETLELDGVKIEAVPAYNIDKQFHPKANGWLGFIIEMNGVRIYHAGDTDHIPEMASFKTDIALLPVSGTYVMTADEAVAAAQDINPQLAIPMHYGAIVGAESDADAFASALAGKIPVKILQKK